MLQIRIHGRGGQGVVTAAEILSIAAFLHGRFAQAFPSFGSERMGAPVTAFCRINDREIRSREPVMQPDAVIVQDPTLLHHVDLFSGLPESGYLLINSSKKPDALGIHGFLSTFPTDHFCTVPASQIALEHLGRPLPNVALIGGFAALTGAVTLEAVQQAVRQRFSGAMGELNAAAAAKAYDDVDAHKHAAAEG